MIENSSGVSINFIKISVTQRVILVDVNFLFGYK